ncbi:Lysophospholipase, alpha-beta hydrolase superfamily [Mucilaginibacter pineti]|uniref:Lysophospholipase, alpha-beta hydrolase superfamily n=1 Tax=Mucilaginibacter pineti TaxID=1391627 RepID=A0A1G7H891_9SPHI|nr:alpha/beta fold hydrolase [Mucilaginibacter pineti]SDE96494.1 Lysophospholipase, alpha-beta hydrolase superfamily [Mucilaginibacter pineti]
MKKTIVFIHGMFQNPVSWEKWISYFNEKGYDCIAPAWPLHEGVPADLRNNPPAGLGDLELQTIVDEMERIVTSLPEKPILIGHSVGGLIVQLLVQKGLAEIGVPINSIAPNAMLAFDWGFMKNSALIANPFKGNAPFEMNLESFHESFCNTMSMEDTQEAYQRTATHDSRNVLRDCMGEAGQIDLDLPHAPLLFIGGEEDQIVPYELNQRNAEAYTDEVSIVDFKAFPNRGHWICGELGWEEVAAYISEWLTVHEEHQYNTTPATL